MTWTQPICDSCWNEQSGNRSPGPTRLKDPDRERCAYCGETTRSGIYVRADPKKVPYPRSDPA